MGTGACGSSIVFLRVHRSCLAHLKVSSVGCKKDLRVCHNEFSCSRVGSSRRTGQDDQQHCRDFGRGPQTNKNCTSSTVEDGNGSMGELTGNLRETKRRTSERMSWDVARDGPVVQPPFSVQFLSLALSVCFYSLISSQGSLWFFFRHQCCTGEWWGRRESSQMF